MEGPTESETLVECSRCGTFISEKEALTKGGRIFCSHQCAQEGV
ncbi:MAG: hypothetical protein GXO19_02810 [Epsilonproteobacteria bacterium]|nr:hypothetical protein [Campylobacterota bacterium]